MGWDRMLIQYKDEVRAWSLTSIEIPIVELGRSYYRLISTMWFPILVRRHLYIESGPRCQYVYHLSNHSLPNTSNDIRWSMDLRWQSPFEKWGFYDIAEGVRFRSSTDPDVKPDWKKFLSVNRKKIWQERHCKGVSDDEHIYLFDLHMMTSSNGNIFRVTGPLCGEFTGPGEFPAQRPVTRSFDAFFDLGLNKRLSKQPWGWWFQTPSWSLWR